MFVLNLVFLALWTTSAGQSDIPRYSRGQWILTDDNLQYEDIDGLAAQESILPQNPPQVVELVTPEEQNSLTTAAPYVPEGQGSDKEEESAVWKIILLAAVLLVSIVGSVSMAYYMCVWRGGRIHYRPQKEGYA